MIESNEREDLPTFSKSEYLVLAILIYMLGFCSTNWIGLGLGEKRELIGLFVLIAAASFFPRILTPLEFFWPRLSSAFHIIARTLLWSVLFFIVFTPFAFVARKIRGDILKLKWKGYESTWRSEPAKFDSIEHVRKSF